MKIMLVCVVLFLGAVLLPAQTSPGWRWATSIPNPGNNVISPFAIATSRTTGLSFVTGNFEGTATFGSTILTSAGNWDAYIACINTNGYWQWAIRVGSTGPDGGKDIEITTQMTNYVYVCGEFTGTVSFGATTLTSAGYRDAFIGKLDTAGNWLWAVRAGGIDVDVCENIEAGNVIYATGEFKYNASFGATNLISSGNHDAFVAKLDTDGNWLWAVRGGGTNAEVSRSITLIGDNPYISGYFWGSATFGAMTISANGSWEDGFAAKLDTDGNWLWTVHFGGNDTCQPNDIIDDGINCYINGYFEGTMTLGPHTLVSNGGQDAFFAKIDAGGAWVWAANVGGSGDDMSFDSCVRLDGVFFTGSFRNSATFGSTTLTSAGWSDVFAAKMDYAGNWIWAKRGGGIGEDIGCTISTHIPSSSLYIMGIYGWTAWFGDSSITSIGDYWDGFVAKIQESAVIPRAPENLYITRSEYTDPEDGSHALIETVHWDPVTLDTNGNPITVDHYVLYASDFPYLPYSYVGQSTACQLEIWEWSNAQYPNKRFYRVTAVE